MFQAMKKKRAIRSYREKLPHFLAKNYGKQRYYTVGQVRSAAENLNLSSVFLCYGYAMFCTRVDFDAHHQETGEHCSYDAMQVELSNLYSGTSGHPAELRSAESNHHTHQPMWHHHDGGHSHHQSGYDVGDNNY